VNARRQLRLCFAAIAALMTACATDAVQEALAMPDVATTLPVEDVVYAITPRDATEPDTGSTDVEAVDTVLIDGINGDTLDVTAAEDVAPDTTGWIDAGACGLCPPDQPLCVNGGCLCTATSCAVGKQCNGGECTTCNTAVACGATCKNCAASGLICNGTGTACVACEGTLGCNPGEACVSGICSPCDTVSACGASCTPCPQGAQCQNGKCMECTSSANCPAGETCDDNLCVACTATDPLHCGSACLVCGGAIPDCAGGKCTCNATSCGAGAACVNGKCSTCVTDSACGASCQPCAAGLKCISGACKECEFTADCAAGAICESSVCVPCTASDAAHCGPSCAQCSGVTPGCVAGACTCTTSSCGSGALCQNGACTACTTAAACGSKCIVCPSDTTCLNGKCAECAVSPDCGPSSVCSSDGVCVACTADNPAYCGPSCLECSAAAPACVAGACQCSGASCGPGSQCVNGSCASCNIISACGPGCGVCGGAAPYCAGPAAGCVACLSNDHCPAGYSCLSNVCQDPCSGVQGCATDIGPNASTCAKARILGRKDAITAIGAKINGDTNTTNNSDDLPSPLFGSSECWDAQSDQFYRVWLVAGETLTATVDPTDFDFDIMLKLYVGTLCESGGDPLKCMNDKGDGTNETLTQSISTTGWHTIVVDGVYAFSDDYDYGPYALTMKITSNQKPLCCL
jgi:hypothetical protein